MNNYLILLIIAFSLGIFKSTNSLLVVGISIALICLGIERFVNNRIEEEKIKRQEWEEFIKENEYKRTHKSLF